MQAATFGQLGRQKLYFSSLLHGLTRVRLVALALALYPCILIVFFEFDDTSIFPIIARGIASGIYNIIFFVLLLAAINCISVIYIYAVFNTSLWLFLFLFTFVATYHWGLYRQLLGASAIYSILDTNRHEAFEFAYSNVRPLLLVGSLVIAAPLIGGLRYSFGSKQNRFGAALVLVALLVVVSYIGWQRAFLRRNNPLLNIYGTIYEAVIGKIELSRIYASLKGVRVSASNAISTEMSTHVLVIGESATSRHMSLYGYNRETSPLLTELRSELYVASDACSSGGTTITSVTQMLSFATREDHTALFNAPNLIQIMKAAHYKTFWISNQSHGGRNESWLKILSDTADERVFVNKENESGSSLDSRLFEPFEQTLADPSPHKFIILHLMGNHAAYSARYPAEFAKFGNAHTNEITKEGDVNFMSVFDKYKRYLLPPTSIESINNDYDNAMLYNDFIVTKYIESLKTVRNSTLTYIADHGEALGETSDFVGHADGRAPKQVYQIPLLFYISGGVGEIISEDLPIFRDNLTKPFQSDRLIHTLLDLYKVEYSLRNVNGSLLSRSYTIEPRYCDAMQ